MKLEQLKEEQRPEDYSLEVDNDGVMVLYKDAVLLDVPTDVWEKLKNEYRRAVKQGRKG